MIDTRAMLADAAQPLTPYSCVSAVAAALPPDSELRKAYEAFRKLPLWKRNRAWRRPLAAARYTAMRLRLAPAREGQPAWGVIDGRPDARCFAVFTGTTWLARSKEGLANVHPSRVIAAWEIR